MILSRYDCLDRSTRAMRMNREMKNRRWSASTALNLSALAENNAVIHSVTAANSAEIHFWAACSWAAHCGPLGYAKAADCSRGHFLSLCARQGVRNPGAAW